jgi:hypothetical protein
LETRLKSKSLKSNALIANGDKRIERELHPIFLTARNPNLPGREKMTNSQLAQVLFLLLLLVGLAQFLGWPLLTPMASTESAESAPEIPSAA